MATGDNYTCTLSEEQLRVSKEELNEDPETRAIEVKTLRQRLDKYPGLTARTDTSFLLRFLRARKFSQEETFELVINYYTARKEEPEIFRDLRPQCVRHVFESGYTTPLGIKDKLGATVILERPGKWEFGRFSEMDLIKADCITIAKIIQDEWVQVHGITLLLDYDGFTLSHFTHTSPSFAKRIAKLWQVTDGSFLVKL
ncbi:alpha-tocopherol transfer protein-like [Aplysia californica]|uniref:Alpha-tocopherol transfer protein-like n=1 Tax=Aplysia californica TaxID=6500 RepID=A0ABM0K0H1_APLCA|nr:alpha-tocopherol transfer protein-like [Aplysia californica]